MLSLMAESAFSVTYEIRRSGGSLDARSMYPIYPCPCLRHGSSRQWHHHHINHHGRYRDGGAPSFNSNKHFAHLNLKSEKKNLKISYRIN